MKYRVLYNADRTLADEMIRRIDREGIPAVLFLMIGEVDRRDGILLDERPFDYAHVMIIRRSYVFEVDRVTPRVRLTRLEPEGEDPATRVRIPQLVSASKYTHHNA